MHIKTLLLYALLPFSLAACQPETTQPSQQTSSSTQSSVSADSSLPAQTTLGFPTVETKQVIDALNNQTAMLIDTRSNDAFNGWIESGAQRGGHLPGAVEFSAQWLSNQSPDAMEKLQTVLTEKGITPNKPLILYNTNDDENQDVARFLQKLGFSDISTYDATPWLFADASLPLESYPNFQILVPAWWIKDVIDGKQAQAYNGNKKIRLFEVGWGPKAGVTRPGFIPGAARMNTDDFEEGPIWNRLSNDRLSQALNHYGITYDTLVILYGVDGPDLMAAFRMYAILKYMGVKDIRVLNGGFAKWSQAEYPTQVNAAPLQPVKSFGIPTPANKSWIIDMPEAKAWLKDTSNRQMVDIRTWDEYIGKTPGYKDITAKGRIPGSYWGKAGSDANNLNDYRNIDNTMKNSEEIIRMWKQYNINPNKQLAFYCGTGWRAAEVQTYAEVMGLTNPTLYDGGWYEWSSDPKNQRETGDPYAKKP